MNRRDSLVEKKCRHILLLEESKVVYEVSLEDTEFGKKLRHSLGVLEKCIQDYTLEGSIISFNGGKDCTVLLHLLVCVIYKLFTDFKPESILCLYVDDEDNFAEVDKFVDDCVIRYGLDLFKVKGNIKDGLAECLTKYPNIKAVQIGARRTDPYYDKMTDFAETNGDWPECMRVHPLLDWSYNEVWHYLDLMKLPYCSLYDQGYTSLGSQSNTKPNPLLKDDSYICGYKSARFLTDATTERGGRYKHH